MSELEKIIHGDAAPDQIKAIDHSKCGVGPPPPYPTTTYDGGFDR